MKSLPLARPHGVLARDVLPVLLLMVLALAASFYSLAEQSMWLDEAFSVQLARLDWPVMWRVVVPDQANMGLYYLLLHLWLRLGMGTGELGVRSLSALLAVVTVLPVYAIGKRLLGQRGAVLASVLLVINAFFVQYGAQEARGYSLAMLLATTSSYLFIRALDRSSLRWWIGYALVAALSLYAHFFVVWVVVAHFVAVLLIGRRDLVLRAVGAQAAAALLAAPLLVPILTSGHLGWVVMPSWRALARFAADFTGHGGPALIVVYALVCGCAVALAARADGREGGAERSRSIGGNVGWSDRWSVWFLVAWLLLPIVATLLFSLLVRPIFQSRYMIVSLPALSLLAAAGLVSIRSIPLRLAALAAMVGLSARGLAAWYTGAFPKENWRDATRYVMRSSRPGDVIAFEAPYVRIPFEYYVHALGSRMRAPTPLFPTAPWGHLPLLSEELSVNTHDWLRDNPPARGSLTFHGLPQSSRLWLVLSHEQYAGGGGNRAWSLPPDVRGRYCLVRTRTFEGIRVQLFDSACTLPLQPGSRAR